MKSMAFFKQGITAKKMKKNPQNPKTFMNFEKISFLGITGAVSIKHKEYLGKRSFMKLYKKRTNPFSKGRLSFITNPYFYQHAGI